ncbi:MAG: DUF47 family protein [Candidatus Thorarchaeota archaeon]|nr:DUF47 family protein [Candidatus Thorarchaeota archaeon]
MRQGTNIVDKEDNMALATNWKPFDKSLNQCDDDMPRFHGGFRSTRLSTEDIKRLTRGETPIPMMECAGMVLDNDRYMSSELGNITKMIEDHMRSALSANKMVRSAIIDWLQDGKNVAPESLEKITQLEEKADELKQAILNELSKANSLMQREDLLRLVNYNDKLLDGAEIALYHLAAVTPSWTPDGEIKEKLNRFFELFSDQITEQREAVRFLSLNIEESMKKADAICRLEKQIDTIQRDIVSILYALDIKFSTLLRFRDFINMMEELSNFSEDAANVIRALSLTLNT